MNYKLVLVEVFAVAAAYLIVSLPAAFATEVSIAGTSINMDIIPKKYVRRDISVSGDDVSIGVSSYVNDYEVESVNLFACGAKNPAECADTVAPDTGPSITYDWNDISDSGTANLMFLVKLRECESAESCDEPVYYPWVGFWHSIEDKSVQAESELEHMDIYVETGKVPETQNWINNEKMNIPFNWLKYPYTVFTGADSIYGVRTSDFSAFSSETLGDEDGEAGDSVQELGGNWYFAFPESGGETMHPITLYSNTISQSECGVGGCELDENCLTCPEDCACTAGYCDVGDATCKPTGIIGLTVTQVSETVFQSCNEPHGLDVRVKVNNPPTGASLQGAEYKLDGADYVSTDCEKISGHYYSCPVTVPAFPFGSFGECGTGSYTVTGNKIKFNIQYPDGTGTGSVTREAGFADITVGSYDCGDGTCHDGGEGTGHGPDLGETASNCCWDCACDESKYCDATEAAEEEDLCKAKLRDSDFEITTLEPGSFAPGGDGDTSFSGGFDLGFKIKKAPSTLSVDTIGASCELDCSVFDEAWENKQVCAASCSASCMEGSVNSDGAYETTCDISFVIPDPDADTEFVYSNQKNYRLTPTLTVSTSYEDAGRETIIKGFSSETKSNAVVGSGYCGDGKQGVGETQDNCCFDTGCADGSYCDTGATSGYRLLDSDQCMPLDGITMDIVAGSKEPSNMMFRDYTEDSTVSFDVSISNPPSGVDYSYSCMFGDGDDSLIQCNDIICEENDAESTNDVAVFSCEITIDSLDIGDYENSDFYNDAEALVIPTDVDFSITFNDGPDSASLDLNAELGNIQIGINPDCGDEYCDPNFEDSNNCCLDCPCPGEDEYCNPDAAVNGQCMGPDDIELVIDSIKPRLAVCCIDNLRTACRFTSVLGCAASGLTSMIGGYGMGGFPSILGFGAAEGGGEFAPEGDRLKLQSDNEVLINEILGAGTADEFITELMQTGIPEAGGMLNMPNTMTIKAHVINAPSDIILPYDGYSMKLGAAGNLPEELEQLKGFTGLNCYEDPDNDAAGYYECKFNLRPIMSQVPFRILDEFDINILDMIPGINTLGTAGMPKMAELRFNIKYGEGDEKVSKELSDTGMFAMAMMKSYALKSTQEEIKDIEKKIADLEKTENTIYAVLGAGAVFCSGQCGLCCPVCVPPVCVICGGCCCGINCLCIPFPSCKVCWVIYACISSVLLTALGFVQDKIADLEQQVQKLNSQIGGVGEAAASGGMMEGIGLTIAKVASFMVCMFGIKMVATEGAAAGAAGGTTTPAAGTLESSPFGPLPPGTTWA